MKDPVDRRWFSFVFDKTAIHVLRIRWMLITPGEDRQLSPILNNLDLNKITSEFLNLHRGGLSRAPEWKGVTTAPLDHLVEEVEP